MWHPVPPDADRAAYPLRRSARRSNRLVQAPQSASAVSVAPCGLPQNRRNRLRSAADRPPRACSDDQNILLLLDLTHFVLRHVDHSRCQSSNTRRFTQLARKHPTVVGLAAIEYGQSAALRPNACGVCNRRRCVDSVRTRTDAPSGQNTHSARALDRGSGMFPTISVGSFARPSEEIPQIQCVHIKNCLRLVCTKTIDAV